MIKKKKIENLNNIANKLRLDSVEMTTAANSGHPTSCASMAELIACVFFSKDGLHHIPTDPKNPNNDKFILSKGHAAPIYWAAWAHSGAFPVADLLTLRKINSNIEGHPTPRMPFVDVATGSLGQVAK